MENVEVTGFDVPEMRAFGYREGTAGKEIEQQKDSFYCPECTAYRRSRVRMALDAAIYYARPEGKSPEEIVLINVREFLRDWSFDHGPRGVEDPFPPEYDGDF